MTRARITVIKRAFHDDVIAEFSCCSDRLRPVTLRIERLGDDV